MSASSPVNPTTAAAEQYCSEGHAVDECMHLKIAFTCKRASLDILPRVLPLLSMPITELTSTSQLDKILSESNDKLSVSMLRRSSTVSDNNCQGYRLSRHLVRSVSHPAAAYADSRVLHPGAVLAK